MTGRIDNSWMIAVQRAYAAGLEDGQNGTAGHRLAPGGFTGCYWEGVGHGAKVCLCPEGLRPKWPDQRCQNCGQRRKQEESHDDQAKSPNPTGS